MMKKLAMNAGLLAFSIVIGLSLMEFGLRLFHPQALAVSYQTRDGLRTLRPSHTGVFRGIETVQAFQTNSFGMRDREHPVVKPPGTYRILLLGDSFMEALQVRYEHSFPPLLERALEKKLKRSVEVVNAAVSGWGTDAQLAYLQRYGERLRPDLILVAMTLTNDVSDNLTQEYHILEGDRLRAVPIQESPWAEYKFWQLRSYLGAHSHLYQLARLWWHSRGDQLRGQQLTRHIADQIQKDPGIRIQKGWRLTFELLKGIRSKGKDIAAETAIFLIPISFQLDDEAFSAFLRESQVSLDEVSPLLPQETMQAFGEREHIEVLDLLPLFKQSLAHDHKGLVLKNDGHWTEFGHELAARIVCNELLHTPLLSMRSD